MQFDALTVDVAKRHIGHVFEMAMNDGSTLDLILDAVAELPTGPSPSAPSGFSLQFRGPDAPVLEQGSYGLSSGGREPQPVFIVPISSDSTGTTYEAVFTRV